MIELPDGYVKNGFHRHTDRAMVKAYNEDRDIKISVNDIDFYECQCAGVNCNYCFANARDAGLIIKDNKCPSCGRTYEVNLGTFNCGIKDISCDCGLLVHICTLGRTVSSPISHITAIAIVHDSMRSRRTAEEDVI